VKVYRVRLKATEAAFVENEEKPLLKQLYKDYLEVEKLVDQKTVLAWVVDPRFISTEIVGEVED